MDNNTSSLSTKEKLFFAFGGLVIVTSAVLIGRKIINNGVANNQENKSYIEGNASTYAKEIKMAFDNDGWWGTDTKALRETLRKISTKNDFKKVINAYHKLYRQNLLQDMSIELQTTEYNEMIAIIAAKPDSIKTKQSIQEQYISWAKRLKAAFDKTYSLFPGTDEEAIKAVFNEIPTQSDFMLVSKVYRNFYNNNLIDDLKSELEFWEISDYLNIINSKPKN